MIAPYVLGSTMLKTIAFPIHGIEYNRGYLVALEGNKEIPFDIKRVYYIFGTKPGVTRGEHAHRSLRQVVIAVSGKCKITLDNGTMREEIWLSRPEQGLVIDTMVWRVMTDFSDDCVLLVLASEEYNPSDYIRDYDEFLTHVQDA